MHKYQSHKIVEAARIRTFGENHTVFEIETFDGEQLQIPYDVGMRFMAMADEAEWPNPTGGWYVLYPDGYQSWHPPDFDDHYDLVQPSSGKSSIKGYRELTEGEIAAMNRIKGLGVDLGLLVDDLRLNQNADQRWCSIGATDLQKGLMSLTRAIAKPEFF